MPFYISGGGGGGGIILVFKFKINLIWNILCSLAGYLDLGNYLGSEIAASSCNTAKNKNKTISTNYFQLHAAA